MNTKTAKPFRYGRLYYKQYEEGFKSEKRFDHQRIIDLCKFKPNDKILEIGCGYGVLLSKICSNDKIGVESNRYAVNYCKKKGLQVFINSLGSTTLPFKNNSMDFIIMNEVIEHLPFPEKIIMECFRLLRLKGKIIITTTSKNIFNRNLDQTHISEMTNNELKRLLEESGFKIICHEVCGINIINFFLDRIIFRTARLLRNKFGQKSAGIIKSCQKKYDQLPINIYLSKFRRNFMFLGTTQLIFAQKGE